MSVNTWLVFVATEFVLCLTPGPAVLFVLSYGLRRGARASLWANGGILAGNTFYYVVSAVGMGAILLASYEAFTAVKFAGAAYLIYLGVRTFIGAGLTLKTDEADTRSEGWRTLARGFALQVANPKALLFFAALLPQFIEPTRSVPLQLFILAVTGIVIECFVLAAYGYLAARAATLARQPRFLRTTNRVSGGMLIAAGAGLALTSDR
jgi:homoserine/homoserine lactone efflux protein